MTPMSSFSLSVFSPMITTSPPSRSTINGMVNRTSPHGISIVKWSGHDCVSLIHYWPNDVTSRACPTNACVNAVPGCPCRACISSSDITVMPDQESMSTLTSLAGEAPGTARHPARCCVRPSKYGWLSTEPTIVSPHSSTFTTETRAE